MAASLLTLRNLVVRYGERTALRVDALEVAAGDTLAIVGPNGAGKSTLLRVMGLLQRPSGGSIRFGGADAPAKNALEFRRKIATVFQEPLLLNATVYQNAALGLKLRGISKAQIKARISPWLERLGIAHLAPRPARSLSGGEAQRVSLARALALEPELLLLDEPWAAVDPTSREEFLRDFARIVKDTRVTTVFVTHDREEAFALAERVAVLKDGVLLQFGSREEVFFRPNSEWSAEIIGMSNRLPAVVETARGGLAVVMVGDQVLHVRSNLPAGTKVMVCVRPEHVLLTPENSSIPECNQFRGRIVSILPGINNNRLVVDCGGFQMAVSMDRQTFAASPYGEGNDAVVAVSPAAVHLIPRSGS